MKYSNAWQLFQFWSTRLWNKRHMAELREGYWYCSIIISLWSQYHGSDRLKHLSSCSSPSCIACWLGILALCNIEHLLIIRVKYKTRVNGMISCKAEFLCNSNIYVCGWKYHTHFNELRTWTKTLKTSLMADFSATLSASDWPIFPYNLGTEAWIEVPQKAEDRAR